MTAQNHRKLRIYLDNCVFNRPFDDQTRIEIKLEAEAKTFIQAQILSGRLELIWSYILEFENAQNPFSIRKTAILRWKPIASRHILENEKVLVLAETYERRGLKAKDALHVACAIEAKADYFVTTDRGILRKMKLDDSIAVVNPVEFVMMIEENS